MKRKISFFCITMLLCMAGVFAQGEPETYDIVVLVNPPEACSFSGGGGKYPYGTVITICVYPNPGYEFVNWTIDSVVVSTYPCFTFTVTGSCTLIANCEIIMDIFEFRDAPSVNIYPNPTTGELTIEWTSGQINEWTSIEFFDVYGRRMEIPHCVRNDVIPSVAQRNEESRTLNISHLPNGIYFIKITTKKGMIVKKIVKY